MRRSFMFVLFMLATFSVSSVWGHMLWINASDYTPKVGESVKIEIAWGHKFPKDEILEQERLARAYAVDPKGQRADLKELSPGTYELLVDQNGSYLVYARTKPGVFTRTPDGFKRQNKEGLDNALFCMSHEMGAKAIIHAGEKGTDLAPVDNDFVEIIPQANPAELKAGDTLSLKIVEKGEPLFRDYIHATYAGFSDEGETFAFSTMVNRQGMAKVKLLKEGQWLIKVPHKEPYPDQEKCDELFHCMTLTFGIK